MSWVTTKLGEVPVVSSSGVTGRHNTSKVKGPGVVTGRYGTLGEVFYIGEDLWPLNTALYVQGFKGNHRRFIAYFLRQILGRPSSDKAAVPGVNRNDLHAISVRFSDPDTQERIATVLSRYDDLIENNRRRIQLLEQAARLLYKEWFVGLRSPAMST
jgi:type I restriction enzyme S subunit